MVECKDCDYLYSDDDVNECHRYPPKCILTNPNTTGHLTTWPSVKLSGEQWTCGEGNES